MFWKDNVRCLNTRGQPLFCSLNDLFGGVLVAVAVVVCLSSLLTMLVRVLIFEDKAILLVGISELPKLYAVQIQNKSLSANTPYSKMATILVVFCLPSN